MKIKIPHQHIIAAVLALMLPGCASIQDPRKMTFDYQIHWPEKYDPKKSVFFVHNQIHINASPEIVWNILVQAETWPSWYEGAKKVKVVNNADGLLQKESVFTWETMGLDFVSTVKEFNPPYRLSWESNKWSIDGYHAWLIIPTENGCRLITDESQFGILAYLERIFQPNKLRLLHDVWLAEIKRKAEEVALTKKGRS